jgi:hypothetical protein
MAEKERKGGGLTSTAVTDAGDPREGGAAAWAPASGGREALVSLRKRSEKG